MTKKEALDFLKILKKSEYRIIEQLGETPTQISILNLLLTSKPHREVLFKILSEAHIPKNISIDKFTHVVKNVLTSNYISFFYDDLTAKGIEHNKVLYISVHCNEKLLVKVLIENESALNIYLWHTL